MNYIDLEMNGRLKWCTLLVKETNQSYYCIVVVKKKKKERKRKTTFPDNGNGNGNVA